MPGCPEPRKLCLASGVVEAGRDPEDRHERDSGGYEIGEGVAGRQRGGLGRPDRSNGGEKGESHGRAHLLGRAEEPARKSLFGGWDPARGPDRGRRKRERDSAGRQELSGKYVREIAPVRGELAEPQLARPDQSQAEQQGPFYSQPADRAPGHERRDHDDRRGRRDQREPRQERRESEDALEIQRDEIDVRDDDGTERRRPSKEFPRWGSIRSAR